LDSGSQNKIKLKFINNINKQSITQRIM